MNNPMTEQEARATCDNIRSNLAGIDKHLVNIRPDVVSLKQREGWKALEYPSWRQCVLNEFTGAASTMYRQLHAGLIEQIIGVAIGDTPEAHLRSMTDLTPEATAAVWEVVRNTAVDGNVTGAHVKAITELCRDVFNSGYIEVGDGEQVAVNEATPAQLMLSVNQEQLETIMRQKQHVRDALERKHGASVKAFETVVHDYQDVILNLPTSIDFYNGKTYRIVFYEVAQEKELA